MLSAIKAFENCALRRIGWEVMMDKWDLTGLVELGGSFRYNSHMGQQSACCLLAKVVAWSHTQNGMLVHVCTCVQKVELRQR